MMQTCGENQREFLVVDVRRTDIEVSLDRPDQHSSKLIEAERNELHDSRSDQPSRSDIPCNLTSAHAGPFYVCLLPCPPSY